jgi:hypothetical protein
VKNLSSPPEGPRKNQVKTGAAYFGNRFLDHAQRDLVRLAEVCDYVVHTISETDLYFHKSALRAIGAATREAGMELWADPWGLGGVFGGESFSRFLLDHPEDWQVLSTGRRVPAACLNRPAFRDFVQEWLRTAQEVGAQVIFWDEPHVFFHWDLEWEGVYSCVCDTCNKKFHTQFGTAPPVRLDESAKAFRRETLADFLSFLMARARELKMRNALCLYAFDGYAEYDRIWERLGSLNDVDVFGTDPYWRWRPARQDPAQHVRRFTERAAALARPLKKDIQIWIQAMRLPKGKESEIGTACRAAVEAGATHVAAWSYDGGALLDPVLSEDPPRVWAEVAAAFAALKSC